jgi:hypothetical protein
MFEVALYTPETAAADWHELADQVFPADVLQTGPTMNPAVFMKVPFPHR